MSPARVTIRDIARAAGVSTTVVSRALNGRPDISQDSLARVLQVARELGYIPNSVARALVLARTATIGVVVTDNSGPIYAELLKGVEYELNRKDYGLLICNSADSQERAIRCIKMLISKGVDGVILTPIQQNREDIELLLQCRIPFVLVFRHFSGLDLDFVILDNVKAGYLATKHLLLHGHRRIGHVAGPEYASSAQGRVEGYRLALHECGIKFDDSIVVYAGYSMAGGYEAARSLLSQPDRPSAIFAATDIQALGVLRAAKEAGLRVPSDLALIGGDDLPFAQFTDPPLTTFCEPARQMGIRAAQILLARLEGKPNVEGQVVFEPWLVIRNSCGCPSGGAPRSHEPSGQTF